MSGMNIPDSWMGAKRATGSAGVVTSGEGGGNPKRNRKKQRIEPQPRESDSVDGDGDAKCSRVESATPTPEDPEKVVINDCLYNDIRCCIRSAGTSEGQSLALDSIISRQPYVKMMQNLFGAYNESCFPAVPSVKVVTKAWEEMHMREPQEDERPCSMGINCECMFIDANMPFTCVEFLLPNDPQPLEQQLCVLCLRKLTQSMFYDITYRGSRFNGIIQSHGNICDQPGEYARQVMLTCPVGGPVQCMPLPIVAHQRNRYSVCLNNLGMKYLKQHRVAWEDFQ